MVHFNWWEVRLCRKGEWKFAWMECLAPCVIIIGTTVMLLWSVDSLDLLHKVSCGTLASIPVTSGMS